MANGARLSSAVMFVQNLDRSVNFYREVLDLEVLDRSATAALLASREGSQLILRSMGSGAVHSLGGVGPQYVIWTAADEADLDRCERVLKELSAHRDTRATDSAKAVEGRDPDDIVVMVTHPGPSEVPMHELPVRIYGW
ncbi:MAG TPA: VOC family protein [Streptosporangiaceae bacterium]|jgi:catechol 2,3-dioxygenase-like lactoylglutathione lyase family enzyme|nr:VOC family protein [Streptosporangiaceae bacterium]